ncbi:MAG: GH36-type glycosyl hydrolase domain-containing protein [Candidatus Hermodarchaeota archaeon]
MRNKAFGSGYFGEWITDEFGLPAYRYTCNQIEDPKAITPVHKDWRSETDHIHQVGNDRLIGVASNYGYIQVRQDEGSPKYLNDYDPKRNQYAGGFGYLIDGTNVLSTFYSGQKESFDRIWGIGYYRKTVTGKELTVDQIVFAPFGDEPLLVSQITIINNRKEPADLRWVEYWGCQMYQFSFKSLIMSVPSELSASELRRRFSERFSHKFEMIGDMEGILEIKKFKGLTLKSKAAWTLIQQYLATKGKDLTGGAVKSPVKEAVLEDLTPPPTFLVSLDAPADGMFTDEVQFFGEGGITSPEGLKKPLPSNLTASSNRTGMFLERKLHLEPGEWQTIYFAYGYLPEGFEIEALLAKYRDNLPTLLSQSCEAWKKERIELAIPDEPWVDRELHWSYYYLRSNLTYDSFFKEHILSQGQFYQYCVGFQGAARDPLQHALPLIYASPEARTYVKEVIRYTLKEVSPEGELPYGITGSGHIMPSPFRPSDQEMWLLWLTSEYVLASKDMAFLEEELPTYPIYGSKAGRARVKDLLYRCYQHLVDKIGTGKHGLQRISNGDWNDGVIHGYVPNERHKDVIKDGESVLNAAMAIFTLEIYSKLLTFVGDNEIAQDALRRSKAQREAVRAQWAGKWFKRAWLTEDLGWVGEKEMWLEPQPWAIIGGVTDPEKTEILVNYIDEGVRQPSQIGAMLHVTGIKRKQGETTGSDLPNGIMVNGGVWPSINGTLIWALSLVDGEKAWDEWKKNTFAKHAEAYPNIWYGIWSGPDTYNSELSKYPGQTIFEKAAKAEDVDKDEGFFGFFNLSWTDFPVMCMHPHAWPLYTATKLIGLNLTPEGIEFSPTLPKDEYKFTSPLIGFEKTKDGYSGWYTPQVAGNWKISLKLSEDELKIFKTIKVNGKEEELKSSDGRLVWSGTGTPNKPLKWMIKK